MEIHSILPGVLLTCLIFCGCHSAQKPQQPAVATESKKIDKPGSSFTDTLTVIMPAVVFYQPDSMQLKRIKMVTDKRIFDGSTHEYFYQQRNAHIFLKKYWPHLRIIDAKNLRFIQFVKADKSFELIDLDKMNDAYGMLVFDTHKPALFLDMTNIESQVPEYFKKN
jgi:hypothetical protein